MIEGHTLHFAIVILIHTDWPALHCFLWISLGTDKPECKRYKVIDDPSRFNYFKLGKYKNDHYLPEGWYAFITGKRMSTGCCYQLGYCDTSYQGRLTGSHPTVDDGIVSRKVCFGHYNKYNGNRYQCKYSIYIRVRNCGPFYVYKLKPTPTSENTRYCTQYQ